MIEPNTRIKSIFLTESGNYIYGTIIYSQKKSSILASGYFIEFDDLKKRQIFLSQRTINELYEIVDETVDKSVYTINDNGQLSFI